MNQFIFMQKKAYSISEIKFKKDNLIMVVDNQTISLKLSDISKKLAHASSQQRNDYKISPSGYGIHWRQLDEDLSVNGLLKKSKSIPLQHF